MEKLEEEFSILKTKAKRSKRSRNTSSRACSAAASNLRSGVVELQNSAPGNLSFEDLVVPLFDLDNMERLSLGPKEASLPTIGSQQQTQKITFTMQKETEAKATEVAMQTEATPTKAARAMEVAMQTEATLTKVARATEVATQTEAERLNKDQAEKIRHLEYEVRQLQDKVDRKSNLEKLEEELSILKKNGRTT